MGRFLEEKIIRTESDATQPSSLYIIPIDEQTFRLIITDDNGVKKISSVLTGNTEFIHLSDAPITYTDNAGKAVIVNDTEDGLIFTDIPPGQDATIQVGEVESIPSSEPPIIENVGTPTNAIFNFKIPKGDPGQNGVNGESATIQVGNVYSLPPDQEPVILNVGTPNNAVFSFELPRGYPGIDGVDGTNGVDGESATIDIGLVTTVAPSEPASVENVGTINNAVFNFKIPKGEQGEKATLSAKPIAPTDIMPTIVGWYKPTVSSASGTTYPNLTPSVDENGVSNPLKAYSGEEDFFYYDGTKWSLSRNTGLSVTGVVEANNIQAVSGGEVYNKSLLKTDIHKEVNPNLIDYSAYIIDGYAYDSSGNEIASSGSKIVRAVPVDALKGNITLSNMTADTLKKLFFTDASNVKLGGISSLSSIPFTRAIPTNAVAVSFSLKRVTESVTPSAILEYGTTPNNDPRNVDKIKNDFITANKLSSGNSVPDPVSDLNAVNKRYLVANAITSSGITSETVYSDNKLNRAYLVFDKYINGTGTVLAGNGNHIIQNHPVSDYVGQNVTFNGYSANSLKKLVFRDSGGAIIGTVKSLSTAPFTTLVPTGAATFDMSAKASTDSVSSYDLLRMNIGVTSLPFNPYSQSLIKSINGQALYAEKSKESEGGGGTAYDQSLNTTDNVTFNSVTTNFFSLQALRFNLPQGAGIPPSEVQIGDAWIDNTDGGVIKVRLS